MSRESDKPDKSDKLKGTIPIPNVTPPPPLPNVTPPPLPNVTLPLPPPLPNATPSPLLPDKSQYRSSSSLLTRPIVSGLVNECDIKELKECLELHPKLEDVFKSSDDLIHALKVISSIKPNERVSTNSGIFIQSELQCPTTWREMLHYYLQPVWLMRLKNGDDRISNLRAIKSIFVGALLVVEESLVEREHLNQLTHPMSRLDAVKKIKNEQLINRMADSISKAIDSMANLKQTYAGDAHACARIDMVTETIRDRLALIRTSLEFLK